MFIRSLLLIVICLSAAQSTSLLDNDDLVKRLADILAEKENRPSTELKTLWKRQQDDHKGQKLCLTGDNCFKEPGKSFTEMGGCYDCVFDTDCNVSCAPNGKCNVKTKMCEYEGKYYPVRKPIFELESDPLCSAYFDEKCHRGIRCERANISPTM